MRGGSITAPPDVRVFMLAAEELAAAATKNLSTLLSCAPTNAASEDTCVDKFIPAFGRRAYRRPLVPAEVEELRALYKAQRRTPVGATFPQAVGNLVTAMLQSPYFLYQVGAGPEPGHPGGPTGPLQPVRDGVPPLVPVLGLDARRQAVHRGGGRQAEHAGRGRWARPGACSPMPGPQRPRRLPPAVARASASSATCRKTRRSPTIRRRSRSRWSKETQEFVASVFQGPKADGKLETLLTSPSSFIDAEPGQDLRRQERVRALT